MLIVVFFIAFAVNAAFSFRNETNTAAAFDFKDELHRLGLLQKLVPFDQNKIHTLENERCKVYNVHVSRWAPHSTRYPAGIACLCDWILAGPSFYGTKKDLKYFFVATRELYLLDKIIDSIKHPFVLISAINDETIPINKDIRIGLPQGFTEKVEDGLWPRLVNHPKIIHWFLENHSISHPKVSTLPIGFVANSRDGTTEPDVTNADLMAGFARARPWETRSTLLLNTDRVRDGNGQWHDRAVVHRLCKANPLCSISFEMVANQHTQKRHEYDEKSFISHVSNAKFVIMAHGGGMDPSPKLMHCIVLGAIPIIESNTLDDAYSQFPVVIIPSLEKFLDPSEVEKSKVLLEEWSKKYAPYYEKNSELRNQTLHILTEEYWWSKITAYGDK